MVMKALQEHPAGQIVEVGAEAKADPNLLLMFDWYPWLTSHYKYLNISDFAGAGGVRQGDNMLIYFVERRNERIVGAVGQKLGSRYQLVEDHDVSGQYRVWLFVPVSSRL
jgi:hypothetical protein